MLFRNVVYFVFLNQGLSLSSISPQRLGQLSSNFPSQLPSTVGKNMSTTPSFLTWLLGIEVTSSCFSLAPEATFLNSGHIFIYVVTFIYSVPECGVTPMLKEEFGSEQRKVVIHCIMGLGCCSSCVIFFYFLIIYLFLSCCKNMSAYPLVATGQRKPEKG